MNVAFADSLRSGDRHVRNGVSGPEERHSYSCGIGKTVRQEIEKLPKTVGPHGAEPRGEIEYFLPRHVGSQAIIESVGYAPSGAGMRVLASGAHYHVIALFNLLDQAPNIIGVMLPVCVHEYDDVTGRRPCSGLDGCAIPHAVAVADDSRASSLANHSCFISGSIVDD